MIRGALAIVVLCAACGDDLPPPVEVAAGRLTARIAPEPAQITLLLDGVEVWSTRAGAGTTGDKHAPPHGFAAIGSRATKVEMMFGSFKFTERTEAEVWRAIDRLADVTPTADGASFALVAGDERVGTGRLVFVAATRSGPDPDAAGFPRHVRLELVTDAQRISLATPIASWSPRSRSRARRRAPSRSPPGGGTPCSPARRSTAAITSRSRPSPRSRRSSPRARCWCSTPTASIARSPRPSCHRR